MTPTPTPAARVSGTTKVNQIAKIIKDNLSGPMFDEPDIQEAHERDILQTAEIILAALQPDPEPVTSEAPMLSPNEPEPVAWLCEDLIFPGERNVVLKREHAESRSRQPYAWKVTPLFATRPARAR